MPSPNALIGSATRYIQGRNAIQTVYWKNTASRPDQTMKLLKLSKTCNFGRSSSDLPEKVKQSVQVKFY
ncbi:hypothetical protein ABEB36_006299 [Hypothenemus hampei]|uniref:Uncharacterized protein n=1 Tax=Hypothenemus hampei TaxID=57062 RepID=A0ABD1EQ27_HYPHA